MQKKDQPEALSPGLINSILAGDLKRRGHPVEIIPFSG